MASYQRRQLYLMVTDSTVIISKLLSALCNSAVLYNMCHSLIGFKDITNEFVSLSLSLSFCLLSLSLTLSVSLSLSLFLPLYFSLSLSLSLSVSLTHSLSFCISLDVSLSSSIPSLLSADDVITMCRNISSLAVIAQLTFCYTVKDLSIFLLIHPLLCCAPYFYYQSTTITMIILIRIVDESSSALFSSLFTPYF